MSNGIADFLGWHVKLATDTLQALEALEVKVLHESDLRGLGRMAAGAVVDQALIEMRNANRLAKKHEEEAAKADKKHEGEGRRSPREGGRNEGRG